MTIGASVSGASGRERKYVSYSRTPYLVVTREQSRRKDIYGSVDDHVVRQAQLLRSPDESDMVFVGMHPVGSPGYLPAFSHLARCGYHVIACGTRYTQGDAGLQMENALVDLAECVRDAKQRWGYRHVVLVGWSGGGALMAGYQAEAQERRIRQTAAGDPTPLVSTELIPGDGLVLMAAHRSRHRLITDFLDASILDEDHPDRREPALNLYDPANPDRPPYPPAFITKYRQAQVDRNRRITARVLERLESLRKAGRPDDEYCFTVQGTMADLRWVDPAVDPNDREAGTSYLGEPRLANDSTAGLARYSSLRGWLSQWALDHAQVDAVEAAPRITVPTLVIANSKDNACPVRHSQDLFAGLAAREKQMYTIPGANHYFSGPSGRDHLDQAVSHVDSWLETLGFAA